MAGQEPARRPGSRALRRRRAYISGRTWARRARDEWLATTGRALTIALGPAQVPYLPAPRWYQ